jgi:adenylosuccinate lyase
VHDRGSQQEQGCAGQWLDRRSGVGVRRHGGILGGCGSGVKARSAYPVRVIERYALPELRELFGERRKLQLWLRIEVLAAEALAAAGVIPAGDWERIRGELGSRDVDPERAHEIEQESQHDVIAFLRSVTERMGPEGRWLHYGLTSSDVLDTATAVVLRDATAVVEAELTRLLEVVGRLARQHRSTPMVGRSHGIHAEPMTFGFKAAGWYAELQRDADRLARARETIAVGKISGAVGTHANVSAEVERHVCESLGLAPDPAATQVVSRDRHAELLTALAILGGTLERISVEVRHLQRTEVSEAFEPFGGGQQGSSAMPHKRNPILTERVSGLARLLRGDALTGLENMALWHERDISHSSAERFVFERALGVAAYATRTLAGVLDGLEVDAERMAANLDLLGGMVYSEALLLAMIAKGAGRQEAYRLVQGAAKRAWGQPGSFRDEVLGDPGIAEWLSADEVTRAMDLEHHLAGIETTYRALDLDS